MANREQDQGRPMQETLNTLPLKDAALYYATHGWPVFPLAGKVPYKLLTPDRESHGHKDATTDPATLHTWWREHPKANIGLPTGEDSGVIVLDMDVPEGYHNLKALQKTYTPLPETRRVRTAHGGLHYYFEYPRDGKRYPGAVGLSGLIGIDVRSEDPSKVGALPLPLARSGLPRHWTRPGRATAILSVSGSPGCCAMTAFPKRRPHKCFLPMPTGSPRSTARTPQKKHWRVLRARTKDRRRSGHGEYNGRGLDNGR